LRGGVMRILRTEKLISDLPKWITQEEIDQLLPKVLAEFKDFVNGWGYEEEWIELQVGDEFFDLNVYDDDCDPDKYGDDRGGKCSASIYPTYKTTRSDTGEQWRETDGSDWVNLYTAEVV